MTHPTDIPGTTAPEGMGREDFLRAASSRRPALTMTDTGGASPEVAAAARSLLAVKANLGALRLMIDAALEANEGALVLVASLFPDAGAEAAAPREPSPAPSAASSGAPAPGVTSRVVPTFGGGRHTVHSSTPETSDHAR